MTSSTHHRAFREAHERPEPTPRPRYRRPSARVARTMSASVLMLGMIMTPIQPASAALPCPTAIAHRGGAHLRRCPPRARIGAFNAAYSCWARRGSRRTVPVHQGIASPS